MNGRQLLGALVGIWIDHLVLIAVPEDSELHLSAAGHFDRYAGESRHWTILHLFKVPLIERACYAVHLLFTIILISSCVLLEPSLRCIGRIIRIHLDGILVPRQYDLLWTIPVPKRRVATIDPHFRRRHCPDTLLEKLRVARSMINVLPPENGMGIGAAESKRRHVDISLRELVRVQFAVEYCVEASLVKMRIQLPKVAARDC
mmetsp:Transcript_20386/g.38341  ORF Transcript_20386/g.38341 Transcript_20386/m.38341 type:complete len:203 (+) Transcript_20386:311-919(+)